MNAIITLKQLRNNPREYIRLLKSGYEVEITEHRKTIVRAVQSASSGVKGAGHIQSILRAIDGMPALQLVDGKLDTVDAVKKVKQEYLQKKY